MSAADDRSPTVPSPRRRRPREVVLQPLALLAIAAVVFAVAVAVLAPIQVPETLHFQWAGGSYGTGASRFSAGFPQSLCPSGARAAIAFTSSGLNVTFGIGAPNHTLIWTQPGPDANASFVVPTCGVYQLLAAGSGNGNYAIQGTVSYHGPLL